MAAGFSQGTHGRADLSDEYVWPQVQDQKAAHCAALFIDIRGSSVMSAELGVDSTSIAKRTDQFLRSVRRLLREGGAATPTMVKSLGDGLLCVWDLKSVYKNREKRQILKAAIHLERLIGKRLSAAWQTRLEVKVGMGLAAGDAAKAKVGILNDYFGYTVNLASKLQGFARPRGLVVDSGYLSAVRSWHRAFGLETRQFSVAMIGKKQSPYFVTPDVYRHHNWTCLSWPGFALHGTAPHQPKGLNTLGISVVTHEGIQGKIGTLEIWPRNDPRERHGDPFELIIDDFDGLSVMHTENAIQLEKRTPHGDDLLDRYVVDDLRLAAADEPFLFIPIRCGLNALSWNTGCCDLSEITLYSDVLEKIANGLKVGLYDNNGATLPVLLECLADVWENGDTVFDANEAHFAKLISLLSDYQNSLQRRRPGAKLFSLNQQIKSLALRLQSGKRLDAVLGGGSWLSNPKQVRKSFIASAIPKKCHGFLWAEGCALLTGAHDDLDYILDFIDEELLDTSYQLSLIGGRPYGSTPVTVSALRKVLGQAPAIAALGTKANRPANVKRSAAGTGWAMSDGARSTIAETSVLFKGVDELRSNVLIRRKPKNVVPWRETWNTIRRDFCEII